jgi:hypothetical protein
MKEKLNSVQWACITSIAIFHCIVLILCFRDTDNAVAMFDSACASILLSVLLLGGEKTVRMARELLQIIVALRWGNDGKITDVDTAADTAGYTRSGKPVNPCPECGSVLERKV